MAKARDKKQFSDLEYLTGLVEGIDDQFSACGEGLEVVSRQTEETNERLERLEHRFDKFEVRLSVNFL